MRAFEWWVRSKQIAEQHVQLKPKAYQQFGRSETGNLPESPSVPLECESPGGPVHELAPKKLHDLDHAGFNVLNCQSRVLSTRQVKTNRRVFPHWHFSLATNVGGQLTQPGQ